MGYSDYWMTPGGLYGRLDAEFCFDTDVAASAENALTWEYFDEQDDGLTSEWGQRNWCNPPYSNKAVWVDKAIEQNERGSLTVMLLPVDTGTKWFSKALRHAHEIRFLINGRIKFIDPETKEPKGGNPGPSMLVVFRGYPNSGQACVSFMEVNPQ